MSNELTIPYVAQLVLALPDDAEQTTLTLTLAPADRVPVGGHSKPLADCTLAELRAYAHALQDEIWAAYDDITLLTLDADEGVEVTVTLLDEAGNIDIDLEAWQSHHVIFPENNESEAGEDSPAEPASAKRKTKPQPAEKAPVEETAPAADATVEPDGTEEAPPPPSASVAPAVPAQKSADLKDVEAAIDIPPALPEEEDDGAPVAPVPAIAPSAARVRVAGQQLPIGSYTSAAVDVLMDEPPLRSMQAHALSSLDREVAGVMVGPRPEKQPDGRYVVRIIDSIAAKYTVMQGASVTYTPDSWRYLNDTLMERYPDETAVMVGWYHTHPGFGIFLSGMDMFIHQNFFTQIWHIAYVLDPRARTSGFFCWNRDRTRVNRYDFAWPAWSAGSW